MENKEAYKFTSNDAVNYDHYLGPLLFEPYGRYIATQINATHLSSVLEVACGTGRVTKYIRRALPANVKLWATDISNDMLDIAKSVTPGEDIVFAVEDMQNLSFADNSFDLVICQFGLMFLPDRNKGLSEIYRVLKPGGRCMIFTWDDTMNIPVFKLLVNDLILPHLKDEDGPWFLVPFSMHHPLTLKGMLQAAGFKQVACKNVALQSGSVSPDHIIEGLYKKHPFGKEVMTKVPAEYDAIAAKFKAGMIELSSNNEIVYSPLSAFLTTGAKH